MSAVPPGFGAETIGCAIAAIDTPALLLDYDALARNIERMAAFGRSHKLAIRPHSKTHKSPMVAQMQIAAGAVGICCQKVGEAEVQAASGIKDILIANEVVGETKLARLAALARLARITVAVDNAEAASMLAMAARNAAVTIGVLVDVDVGQGRCGVLPGEPAVEIGRAVARLHGLELRGLQAYHGGIQHIANYSARAAAASAATAKLAATAKAFRRANLPTTVVSGAGTGTYTFEGRSGALTEIQPGSYVFMDRQYREIASANGPINEEFESAIFVLATVMSVPGSDRVVTDAGLKALSTDAGPAELLDHAGWTYAPGGDEHGILRSVGANAPIVLGAKVRLRPSHCDTTVNLYDSYHVVSGGRLIAVWPVAARGRSR